MKTVKDISISTRCGTASCSKDREIKKVFVTPAIWMVPDGWKNVRRYTDGTNDTCEVVNTQTLSIWKTMEDYGRSMEPRLLVGTHTPIISLISGVYIPRYVRLTNVQANKFA